MHKFKTILPLFLGITLPFYAFAQAAWQRPNQPPDFQKLQAVIPHPLQTDKILVASSRQIFEGDSKSWKPFTNTLPSLDDITRIFSFPGIPETVFILTPQSLWAGDLKKQKWTPVHQTRNTEGFKFLSFAVAPDESSHWFLGTTDGLLESDDGGKTWFRFPAFRNKPISFIAVFSGRLFIGTSEKLFCSTDRAHFESVFSFHSLEAELEEDFEEVNFWNARLFTLIASPAQERLWLGTQKGVFESWDNGETWQPLARAGLRSSEAKHLAYSSKSDRLFAGTSQGIYEYDPDKEVWRELFEGLDQTFIRSLVLLKGKEETLAALTPAGFFQYPISIEITPAGSDPLPQDRLLLLRTLIKKEPSAREIQKAVIRYANLSGGKIKRWHTLSRVGSFLPSLSFGKNFSRGNNIDLDRGGTSDPDRFIYGPDDVGKSWDMDIGWDLKDFLYSSDQTSIDSREKLMVELRNDMLAEAMRIYFERRRLQVELVFHPAESEEDHFSQLLRIDELTALLDSMTNGYLSKRLEQIYERNIELHKLWEFQK